MKKTLFSKNYENFSVFLSGNFKNTFLKLPDEIHAFAGQCISGSVVPKFFHG